MLPRPGAGANQLPSGMEALRGFMLHCVHGNAEQNECLFHKDHSGHQCDAKQTRKTWPKALVPTRLSSDPGANVTFGAGDRARGWRPVTFGAGRRQKFLGNL